MMAAISYLVWSSNKCLVMGDGVRGSQHSEREQIFNDGAVFRG